MEKFDGVENRSPKKMVRKSRFYLMFGVCLVVLVVACVITAYAVRNQLKTKGNTSEKKSIVSPTKLQTTAGLTTTPKPTCTDAWCNVRLPADIRPSHYNLSLQTSPPDRHFNGTQTVTFDATKPTDLIIFHIKLLKVTSVKVRNKDSSLAIGIKHEFEYAQNEFYVVKLSDTLKVDTYILSIEYKGNISTELTGFYQSSYTQDGKERVLFTTKFQATDARKAFPCFDEPELKANFTIEIHHPSNYDARSNMPGVTTSVDSSNEMTKFETSVTMSTYLVCFVVSQFKNRYSGKTGKYDNIDLAIWSRPDFVNDTKYAFDNSVQVMTFLEEFLNVSYPMPKLDMFAIPDYGSGATEHWGIITYREKRLLYIPGVTSESSKHSSAAIIAHECAHLWFGNLVTCKWWNDLWIQEGMASYLEFHIQNHTDPQRNMFDAMIAEDWSQGISLDSLSSSHPISQPVDHPKQIREIFDTITYKKGASLFQMLDFYLDSNHLLFRKALQYYLENNAYKGAVADDLWHAFSKVTGQDFKAMMNTWTKQLGYPVITINKTKDHFILSQSHFLLDPTSKVEQKSDYNYKWIIPFTYSTNTDLTTMKKLRMETDTIQLNVGSSNWIMGNFNHRGFYRVNYDVQGWKEIINTLDKDFTVFSVADRAGLINDVFALAQSGHMEYSSAFDLIKFIDNDDNKIVWKMALGGLTHIEKLLSSTPIYSQYLKYLQKKIKPLVKKYNESSTYLSIACKFGDEDSILKVNKMFIDWLYNGTKITPALESTVLFYGIRNSGLKEWQTIHDKWLKTKDSQSLQALYGTLNPALLKKLLFYSLDSTKVRSQDTVYVISTVARNPVGKYVAWEFANDHWDQIFAIATANNFHTNVLINGLTSTFTTKYELEKTRKLFASLEHVDDGRNARKQSLERIQASVLWLKTKYPQVKKWLEKKE